MKKKLWAVLVAFVALTVFATSAFAAVRWRNVASIYPGISAGDNSYTCEISCLSGTTKIDCTLVLYEKGLFGTFGYQLRIRNIRDFSAITAIAASARFQNGEHLFFFARIGTPF